MIAMLVVICVFLVLLGTKGASGRKIGPGEKVGGWTYLWWPKLRTGIVVVSSLHCVGPMGSSQVNVNARSAELPRPKLWLAEGLKI